MANGKGDIVTAGHICLDLIPLIETERASVAELIVPGTLVNVGPAVVSTGGSVANTGLALHKIGVPVRLVGKVGEDAFGQAILSVLDRHAPSLRQGMIVDPKAHTSYTMVISPPGIDRTFLHHPGANDSFGVEDMADGHFAGAAIFHFGYPPLMRRFYSDGGEELAALLHRARDAGAATSLDLSYPDPESESGRVDWKAILRQALPHTDVFLPSLDEIAYMLGVEPEISAGSLDRISGWLLDAGAAVVAIKLGDAGLMLRSAGEKSSLQPLTKSCGIDPGPWAGRELLAPCFSARLVGTTGAGDCTIAGFLAELREGSSPEEVLRFATAVGACSVEAPDATGGVRPREEVRRRLAEGWERLPTSARLEGWTWDEAEQLWRGRDGA